MPAPIEVLLLDDHAVVRDGLAALLRAERDIAVVGSFGSAVDAVEAAVRAPPDIALLDIALPGIDGIEAARRIHDLCPGTQIVMLSMHASPEHVYQALHAGALGYVLKESAGQEVVSAVRTVHSGRRYLSQKISAAALDDYVRTRGGEHPLERLSARERQVLKLIVEGNTSNEVAGLLGLSPKSVDTYRSRLMAKLQVEDLPALVKFAIRHGITTTE
jgi:DNA-binding NarL/FixJ family response regulator